MSESTLLVLVLAFAVWRSNRASFVGPQEAGPLSSLGIPDTPGLASTTEAAGTPPPVVKNGDGPAPPPGLSSVIEGFKDLFG